MTKQFCLRQDPSTASGASGATGATARRSSRTALKSAIDFATRQHRNITADIVR